MDRQEQQDLRFLGEAIRSVREERGLTVAALATSAGVAGERIAALESGRLDPGFDLMIALARGMGVRLPAIFLRAEELTCRAEGGKADDQRGD